MAKKLSAGERIERYITKTCQFGTCIREAEKGMRFCRLHCDTLSLRQKIEATRGKPAKKSEILTALEAAHGRRVAKLLYYDDKLSILDAALSAAEEELESFLGERFTPDEIAQAFEAHIRVHLREELDGAKRHNNNVADYREACNNGEDS